MSRIRIICFKIFKECMHLILGMLSNRQFVQLRHWYTFGTFMDLDHPKTLNEKINVLKFRQTDQIYSNLADKYKVRQYIADTVGSELLVKLYWMGKDPEAIHFSELPIPYVIKCNHGSGFNIFIREKSDLNIPEIQEKLREWLKIDFSRGGRELHYRGIERRIIIEEILLEKDRPLITDYRFFCFNGVVRIMQLKAYQNGIHRKIVYTPEWVKQDYFFGEGEPFIGDIPRPKNLDRMIELAQKIAQAFVFVRVDLYNLNGEIYFSELTFTSDNGFGYFQPKERSDELGRMFGDMLEIDHKNIAESIW